MKLLPTDDPSKIGLSEVEKLVKNATDIALYLVGGIAVIYLIIGAYYYLTAFGNEEKAGKAKTTIYWAIAGVAVIILAKVIINEVFNLVSTTPPAIP